MLSVIVLVLGATLQLGPTAPNARALEAQEIATAIEEFVARSDAGQLTGGFRDSGVGWFSAEFDANYANSIRHELVDAQLLDSETAKERYHVDYLVYFCIDRYAVFAPVYSEDEASLAAIDWWTDNGCIESPLTIYSKQGVQSPHVEGRHEDEG